jgi:hypothetical protein
MLLHKKDDNPNKERCFYFYRFKLNIIIIFMFIRHGLLQSSVERYKKDGLSSLKYTILNKKFYRLYTWVLVKINETDFN